MRLRTNRPPYAGRLETSHDAIRCGQPVRAPASEYDRMHPVDRRRGMQEVSLSSARAAAAYIHPADRSVASQHHGRPGEPAFAVGCVVADLESFDHVLILPTCQTPVEL